MWYLREEPHRFPFPALAHLFQLSKSRVYEIVSSYAHGVKRIDDSEKRPYEFSGPNSLMTIDEEREVLEWIAQCQREGDCPQPKQVRVAASEIRAARCDDHRLCTKEWWRGFRKRNKDNPIVSTVKSQESERNQVTVAKVQEYFGAMRNALSIMKTPSQLLNMDETGVSSRPVKDKKKTVVSLKNCPTKPAFQDLRDVSYVSACATVSLGGESPLVSR
jgi:hypothetical protein